MINKLNSIKKVNILGAGNSPSTSLIKTSQLVKTNPQQNKASFFPIFDNLSINRKQLIGFIICELVPILGIGIGGTLIINQGLQNQLLEQAKSELAVTESHYNIKVNQLASRFLEKAENPAIINAATAYNSGQVLNRDLQEEIKKILEDEIKVNKIEYATLVSKDLKIIANANNDRKNEVFNPDNLVSDAINNSTQIKANSIIQWSELSKELPFLASDLKNKDSLIRYTIIPVKDKTTQTIIGALVSGKVVNEKETIVKDTVKYLRGGYSAIYLRNPSGKLALVTSLNQEKSSNTYNFALPKEGLSLLQIATKNAEGKAVARRLVLGKHNYAIAAKTIPNKIIEQENGQQTLFGKQPVAILVRGIPETTLNNLLIQSWQAQALTVLLGLLLIIIWRLILKRSILKQIQNLHETTQKFTAGDVFSRATVVATDEIGQLAISFNTMADRITQQAYLQNNEAKLTTQLNDITTRIRELLNTETILNTLVSSTREVFEADKVIFYRLDDNWQGKIVAESAVYSWSATLGTIVSQPYLSDKYSGEYEIDSIKAVDNIYTANLKQQTLKYLEPLAIKAYLLAPVFLNKKLYGLLVAHQCSDFRKWLDIEINLFKQIAVQVGYALEQAELVQHIEQRRQTAEIVSFEEDQQKETLQTQLMQLVDIIECAARGNLTVRAEVTAGEIGTVADFFNSIIESLRGIVTQVKQAATQVNQAIGANEGAIRYLAEGALTQAVEINRTLEAVDNMTHFIEAVAKNAQQAATVANNAAHTAKKSGVAMDMTVQNILHLRETVGDTAKKVKRLGESTHHISRVVALINDISMQTNLLAINAGIEASRAGEEGQGFVVVAEEVGELATQSAAATKEIEQIVENIQRETSEVVQAMELGTTQVVESTRIVEDTKQNLAEIVEISRQIDLLVHSISQATASQAETSQAVSHLMKGIANSSQHTSDSSHQVSQSLTKTLQIAEELRQAVGAFQVS